MPSVSFHIILPLHLLLPPNPHYHRLLPLLDHLRRPHHALSSFLSCLPPPYHHPAYFTSFIFFLRFVFFLTTFTDPGIITLLRLLLLCLLVFLLFLLARV